MTAAWEVELPDSEKLVLLALADCANDGGECWPSMRNLSKKCSKSDRTVQAAIKELAAKGHLTRKETPGRGCRYIVHPRRDFAPEDASPPKRLTPTPETASDKPSRTITSSTAKAVSDRARPKVHVPDWVPIEAWNAFTEMRRRGRNPFTGHAEKLALAKLEQLRDAGNDPADVLNQSILRGYSGLFEIRSGAPSGWHSRPSAWTARPEPISTRTAPISSAECRDLADRMERIGKPELAAEYRSKANRCDTAAPLVPVVIPGHLQSGAAE